MSKVTFAKNLQKGPDHKGERTCIMYHGTTMKAARTIKQTGFIRSVGGMLGSGVYVSRSFKKAACYPKGAKGQKRAVLKLSVCVGRVKKIDRQGHHLQKSWHQAGYDTAWVPPNCGMVKSGREENCVWDPERIRVLSILNNKRESSDEESTDADDDRSTDEDDDGAEGYDDSTNAYNDSSTDDDDNDDDDDESTDVYDDRSTDEDDDRDDDDDESTDVYDDRSTDEDDDRDDDDDESTDVYDDRSTDEDDDRDDDDDESTDAYDDRSTDEDDDQDDDDDDDVMDTMRMRGEESTDSSDE
ncbi:serine-aspartate repeat-containing protein D-like [Neoarius graeffei]|uniref:serine-aspartate repeat-containing protein D-like n=1 Tax=Neoarius graeffei TaxID=443677 RepID=UPI00298CE28A|nr:serine-aspartate repeat-containing protein D-like [Neoarius graeffei]